MNQDHLIALLAQRPGYVSGQEMSQALGVTRGAIWKELSQLREQGWPISSSTRLGYRLDGPPPQLSAPYLEGRLSGTISSGHIHVFDRLDSTNTQLKAMAAQGAPHGTVVAALEQTSGRGTRGRTFASPPGGLYLSVLLRPQVQLSELFSLTGWVAVAVRQALLRAFDRSSAVTARLSRHAQAAALPVSPVSPLYDAELAQALAYDTGAAEELLTQAGYSRSDGVWQRRGTPLSLTLAAPTNNPTRLDAAELLVANLTDLGIQAELAALPWDDYVQALESRAFDLYLGEVRLTADFDLTALITPGGALNYGGYSNAQTTGLHNAFRAASGAARTEAAAQLYAQLAQEPPFAVICFKNWSVLMQWNQLSGLSPTQQNLFYQFDQWEIS